MPEPDPTDAVPITVEMFVPDVEASVRFYTGKLGFTKIRMERGELAGEERATFAIAALGSAVILFAHESLAEWLNLPLGPPAAISVRIMVPDVDAMFQRARDNGVAIVADISDRHYGLRDFSIRDANGFHLRFASPLA